MVTGGSDVENREEGSSLSGRKKHSCRTAFQFAQPGSYCVGSGVLEPGVEVTGGFQIKKLAHILAGFVAEGSGLHNGNISGFSVAGPVACMEAFTIKIHSITSFVRKYFAKITIFFYYTRCLS
jgi:hypothetical protein